MTFDRSVTPKPTMKLSPFEEPGAFHDPFLLRTEFVPSGILNG